MPCTLVSDTVMILSSYLSSAEFKFNQRLLQSQLPTNIAYLASDYPKHTSCAASTPQQFSDPHLLQEAYRQRARRMIEVASAQYQAGLGMGLDNVAAWNSSSVDWTNAAQVSSEWGVTSWLREIMWYSCRLTVIMWYWEHSVMVFIKLIYVLLILTSWMPCVHFMLCLALSRTRESLRWSVMNKTHPHKPYSSCFLYRMGTCQQSNWQWLANTFTICSRLWGQCSYIF